MLFRSPSAELAIRGAVFAGGATLVAAAARADARWFEDHWLGSYCTRSAATPPLEAAIRLIAGGLGVALITWTRPRIARWVSRHDLGKLARSSAGIALAVVLSLVASDVVLRLRHAGRNPAEDPVLPPMTNGTRGNWVLRASSTKDVSLGKRRVRYEIDANGNRAPSSRHVTDPNAPSILFTGESVGMGWGVAYEDSYPALVAGAMGVQAVNVAVTGFGNDQAYLRALDALARLAQPRAVVTIVLSDQLERDVRPTRDRLVLTPEGRLELEAASTSLFATSPLRRLMGYHSADAIALARAIFQATAEVARSRGALPVFLWTNYGRPCDHTDRGTSILEERLFSGLEATHVRVDIAADQTIEGAEDAHPDEKGHQALAKAVLGALTRP